jgi:hypothetical protein
MTQTMYAHVNKRIKKWNSINCSHSRKPGKKGEMKSKQNQQGTKK